MRETVIASGEWLPAELYVELKDFYAHHIKKRDAGFTDQWIADFDENGTLSTNIFDTPPQKVREKGVRERIEADLHALDNHFARRGIQRLHLLGNFATTRGKGDTIHARHYGLLLTTKSHEGTSIHSTSVATDLLRYCDDMWRVLSRHIERDDLPQSSHSWQEEIPMTRNSVVEQPVKRAETYYLVEQFYAHQMQILDSGDAERWAATFTKDGTFSNLSKTDTGGGPIIVAGRGKLLALAEKSIAELASEGVTRRHLVSTLTIDGDGDSVRTHCYVLIIDTRDGTTALNASFVLEDLLVFSTAGWLVEKRTIRRD